MGQEHRGAPSPYCWVSKKELEEQILCQLSSSAEAGVKAKAKLLMLLCVGVVVCVRAGILGWLVWSLSWHLWDLQQGVHHPPLPQPAQPWATLVSLGGRQELN